jgi:acetoin utilization deacetylase AcuC-like enzyme
MNLFSSQEDMDNDLTTDPRKNTKQTAPGCFPQRLRWFFILSLPLLSCAKGGDFGSALTSTSALCIKSPGYRDEGPIHPALRTGFICDNVCLGHELPQGHPERPERLVAIVERLGETGLLAQLEKFPPRSATEEWLTKVHTADYVRQARADCRHAASYDAALAAAGGVLTAVDSVVAGKIHNAFCAVRPPGHHATKDSGGGFCVFNNVAVAARYAQQKHKLAKILIVDWDAHHGNGTQSIFYEDPSVLYFSVHRRGTYGTTGRAAEASDGKGIGLTINVPLEAGLGDAAYRKAFEEKLLPAARQFRPDLVLVSAGFDAGEHDRCGMRVTAAGFADLTRTVKDIARKYCNGRLVTVLEGGYNLDGLAECVESHVRALME